MKILQVKAGKEMKVGLPNYSNITANCEVTFEIKEGEDVDWDKVWDLINRQLSLQVEGIEPAWITRQEFGKFFKVTVKIPKYETSN